MEKYIVLIQIFGQDHKIVKFPHYHQSREHKQTKQQYETESIWTKEGVELFFDEEKYDYSSDNMPAVEAALKEDMSNYRTDPQGAAMAHNLMAIMQSMDAVKAC